MYEATEETVEKTGEMENRQGVALTIGKTDNELVDSYNSEMSFR